MFKHVTLFRIGAEFTMPDAAVLEEELARGVFLPCEPTQERSSGWIPPRGQEHGALVEVVGGQWLLKLAIERKAVPGAAVKAELEARCKALEQETGRKPGRKEKAELKELILHALLPRAFAKRSATTIWIDPASRLVVVDTASMRAAEPALKALVDLMANVQHVMPLAPVNSSTAPAAAMAHWLKEREAPAGFTIDRELELKAPGEERSVVRYSRHSLDLDEIGEYIAQGKMPTRLAMTWDGRMSFELTDALALRRIDSRDVEQAESGADAFDANVALFTGEMLKLVPDLLEALGGELVADPVSGEMGSSPATQAQAAPAPHTGEGPDPLLSQAVAIVLAHNKASISLVQRHLKIGYNRAARLVEEMERQGLVSSMDSQGARRVLESVS